MKRINKKDAKKQRQRNRQRLRGKPKKETPQWKSFELAVTQFVKDVAEKIDPNVKVEFDKHVPNVVVPGETRQADAWVEHTMFGHYPVKILISCKDVGRKLGSRDIGTFKSEVHDVGANFGIIYARSGFYGPAVIAAKNQGITCCRLYRNQPADRATLVPWTWFACDQLYHVTLTTFPTHRPATWGEMLDLPLRAGESTTVIEELECLIHDVEKRYVPPGELFPVRRDVELRSEPNTKPEFSLKVEIAWRYYRGKHQAYLLDGSYCYINDSFVGNIRFPSIDFAEFPGDQFELLSGRPEKPKAGRVGIIMRAKPAVKKTFLEKFAGRRFEEDNP